MKEIVTYIREGFYSNIGANKYIDTIKNFGKILADKASHEELKATKWTSDMPRTKVYKNLYDLFNDINKYEVKFNVVYNTGTSLSETPDICTQHFICTRNGDDFSFSYKETYKNLTGLNRSMLIKCKDVSEFLCNILYYIQYSQRLNILRNTAKFIVK